VVADKTVPALNRKSTGNLRRIKIQRNEGSIDTKRFHRRHNTRGRPTTNDGDDFDTSAYPSLSSDASTHRLRTDDIVSGAKRNEKSKTRTSAIRRAGGTNGSNVMGSSNIESDVRSERWYTQTDRAELEAITSVPTDVETLEAITSVPTDVETLEAITSVPTDVETLEVSTWIPTDEETVEVSTLVPTQEVSTSVPTEVETVEVTFEVSTSVPTQEASTSVPTEVETHEVTYEVSTSMPTQRETLDISTSVPTQKVSTSVPTQLEIPLIPLFGNGDGQKNLVECQGDCDRDSGRCHQECYISTTVHTAY